MPAQISAKSQEQPVEPAKKILLVDDEADFLKLLKDIVSSFGHQAETAGTGLQAIEKLAAGGFDLVITDMIMPEMGGMELLEYIREKRLDYDVIVATGYSEQYTYSDIIRAGACDFLVKPIDKAELRAKLDRIFREQLMNSALQEKQAQLAHAARLSSIGATASTICHELNQPLNTIALTVSYLDRILSKQTAPDPEIVEGVDDIRKQLDRAAGIIDNIRSFSRKDDGSAVTINPAKSVAQAVSFFQQQFRLRSIDLVLESSEVPLVRFSPQKLEQIVVNLLTNARYAVEKKAAESGPDYRKRVVVRIAAGSKGESVIIEVSDNGVGMTPEERRQCLEPFFTTKKNGEGTGLGLAIVRDFIEEFDSRLVIESTAGEGSTFRLLIPAAAQS